MSEPEAIQALRETVRTFADSEDAIGMELFRENLEIVAAYDVMKQRAESAEAKYGVAHAMTDAKEPEFIEALLHSEECGRSLLYDVYENEVCSIAEIVNHIDTLTRERDALRADAAHVQKYRLGGCVLVPVSRELLSKDWSKQPLFIRIDDNGDGTHSMTLRESTAALAVQP